MTFDESYNKFCTAMNKVARRELGEIKLDERLSYYEFDSLDEVELIMETEKILDPIHYKVIISDNDAVKLCDSPIIGWCNYIQEHCKED